VEYQVSASSAIVIRPERVSRQRAQQLVREAGFPPRASNDATGPLWRPADVRRGAKKWAGQQRARRLKD
jgi:hypothetical protein